MKKILCYISISLLILLIIIPPVFRIVFKDRILSTDDLNNNQSGPKNVINTVICNNDSQNISLVYVDGNIKSLKYQISLSSLEINPTNIIRDDLIKENISNTLTDTTEEYFVKFDDITGLKQYKTDINTNKTYFESLGFTCNVSKY